MNDTTYEAVKAILKADPSVTTLARNQFLALLRNGGQQTPKAPPTDPVVERIIRVAETARLLSRSPRGVHLLAQQGILEKIRLPGRTRASGFRLSDIQKLIAGQPHLTLTATSL